MEIVNNQIGLEIVENVNELQVLQVVSREGGMTPIDYEYLYNHNHNTLYYTENEVDLLLEGKANTVHLHSISDVSGLQTALDNKADDFDLTLLATKTELNNYRLKTTPIAYSEIQGRPINLTDLAQNANARLTTDTEKSTWNNKSNFSGAYNDLIGKPDLTKLNLIKTNEPTTTFLSGDGVYRTPAGGSGGTSDHTQLTNRDTANQHPISAITGLQTILNTIPNELSDLLEDETHRVVTDVQITNWNNKSNFSGDYDDLTSKPFIASKLSELVKDINFDERYYTETETNSLLTGKQASLVSGTNIKTINNSSLLGSGNIDITSGVWGNITGTLSNQTDLQAALNSKQAAGTYSTDIHSNITALDNVSGTNTGDETTASIKTKLGAANTSTDGYLSSTDWNTFNNKQSALGFTAENSANKENTTIDTNTSKYPTVNLLKIGLDAKENSLGNPDADGKVLSSTAAGVRSWVAVSSGGLTNFTESNYTYNTKTGVKLLATNEATNVDVVLQPKGTGAILAEQPDGASDGGINRGDNAVDFQKFRGSPSQVASGADSIIGNGYGNTASAQRTGVFVGAYNEAKTNTYATVLSGQYNQATGQYSVVCGGGGSATGSKNLASGTGSGVVCGNTNTASGEQSFVGGGYYCTASGAQSFVGSAYQSSAGGVQSFVGSGYQCYAGADKSAIVTGGSNNIYSGNNYSIIGSGLGNLINTGQYSIIGSGYHNRIYDTYGAILSGRALYANIYAQSLLGGYNDTEYKTRQDSKCTLQKSTSDATLTEMNINTSDTTKRLVLKDNQCWGFEIFIVAKNSANAAQCAYFKRSGLIYRGSGANTTTIEGSVQTIGTDIINSNLSGIAVEITANTTNGALKVSVQGLASTTIIWQAKVNLVEIET